MLYAYQCSCGYETEAYNKMADRHTHAPVCGKNATHGQMTIKLTAPMFTIAADCAYKCPLTNQVVTSHRQRKNIMRERNVVDARDFTTNEAIQKGFAKAEKEQEKDRALIRDLQKDLNTGRDRPFTPNDLLGTL